MSAIFTDDAKIEARADLVANAIFLLADEISLGFDKESKEVQKSDPGTKNALKMLILWTNLFHAELFFREQISNTKEFTLFKQRLETYFNVDHPEAIKFLDWIRQVENPLKAFDSQAAKIVSKNNGAITAMHLTVIYSGYLLYGFYDSLRKAWGLVSDYPNI